MLRKLRRAWCEVNDIHGFAMARGALRASRRAQGLRLVVAMLRSMCWTAGLFRDWQVMIEILCYGYIISD